MDTMIRKSPYVVLLLTLVLAGCGSSPAVRYYGLDNMDVSYAQDPDDSPVLVMGPFRMPEYLNRSQMVTRGSGAEMIVHDVSRWSEPLDDAIHRVLASNVDSLLQTVIVLAYPSIAALDADYRLAGRINRFSAGQDGRVILEAQWGLGDADGDVLIAPRRSRYESQASEASDPGSIARAMSDALAQFSRDIASKIESVGLE